MIARNLILGLSCLASVTVYADFTYQTVTLHGDGSVTYQRPVYVNAAGHTFFIHAGAAAGVCRAFGFESMFDVAISARHDPSATVTIASDGRVQAPAPSGDVIDEVHCGQAGVGISHGFFE